MAAKKHVFLARTLSLLLCLALLAGLVPAALAIDADSQGEPSITLDSSNQAIKAGEYFSLKATITALEDATIGSISWKSDNSDIASVSGSEKEATVHGEKAGGPVAITATVSINSQSYSATCSVTVEEAEPENIPVQSIQITQTSLKMTVGDTTELSAKVTPSDATNQSLSWKIESGETNCIELQSNGTVKAIREGTVFVVAEATDGSNITSSNKCEITVSSGNVPVESISLDYGNISLAVGDTRRLNATVYPTNASNKSVTWESNRPDIASVSSDGSVTGKAAGEAQITVKTADGNKTATCKVTVTAANVPVTGVTVAPTSVNLAVGNTQQLTATVAPSNATNKSVTWSSNNNAIATVSASGLVTAKSAGTAVITATTADGGKTATCTVTVTATSVKLNQTTASLIPNQVLQLSATVTTTSTNKTVTWSSNNTSIATVTPSGLVTAIKNGTAVITAAANDGSGQKATCTVTVSNGTLSLNTSSLTLTAKGSGSTLTATTAPDAEAANVKWNITGNGGIVTLSTNQGKTCTVSPTAVGKTTVRASVTISGTTYTADCQVTVTSADAADITYSTARSVPVTFSANDFNNTCSALTGRTLNYVNFTLPASSQGTLYYDYKSNGSYDSKVASSTNYYRSSSRYLDRVTFVPNDSFSGTVTINYSARDTQDTAYSGRVIIKVGSNTGTVTYTTEKNKTVTLDNSSFNRFSQDMTGNSFNYIRFTSLPGSSRGTLYYDYSAGDSRHKAVDTSTNYFRSKSSYLDRITFVPKSDFTGTVSIPFTGQDSNGTSFSGTLKFYVGTGAADISYSATSGQAVNFNASDFNDYCKDVTGSTLDYVRFTLPTRGALYYNYSANGNYEKTVSASTSYYRSSSPYLSSVSYVPDANSPTSVLISFTGWSTSRESFSGTVAITYTGPQTVSALRYSTNGSPVVFRSQDFAAVCNLRGTTTLSYVSFSLPNAAQGTLYSNYVSPAQHGTEVMPGIPYYVGSNPPLDGVTFLPKASFSGTATVSYTARDSAGGTYNGTVNITVTPVTASATFTDVGTSYSWCAPSVDFLYRAGVVTGVDNTHYAPAQAISRGDFVLMLYRAFGMRASGNTSFTDVPADSYYAQAIAAAKAMGVATGTGDGTFRPKDPLTRQDAMLLLQRTLSATGQGIAGASDSVISRFSDQAQVASYARSAVCAMVQAGVIQGDSSGKLNPTQSLTRGEMATILHRVITL